MKATITRALLRLLRAYKRFLSPLFPPACRYVPTCSEYATEAIARYGALRGSGLALWRLLRCHPLVRGGFDPVPVNAPALGEYEGCQTGTVVGCSATSHD